jgi:hypothetical protein
MNGIPKKRDANKIQLNRKVYRQVNMPNILYIATAHCTTCRGALVDRGVYNGGIGGEEDILVISCTGRSVNVQGIDDHQIVDIPIITMMDRMDHMYHVVIMVCISWLAWHG